MSGTAMQLSSNLYLQLTLADYTTPERWWEDSHGKNWWNRSCVYDFDMIYYVKVGQFDLYMDGTCFHLKPGQMAYIPAGTHLRYDHDGQTVLEKYYAHFYLHMGGHPITDSLSFPRVIRVRDTAEADRLFCTLLDAPDELGLAQRGILLQLIAFFLRESGAVLYPADAMQQAVRYICSHTGETISIAQLAQQSGYSKDHFTRKFKEVFGRTPRQYIADIKLAQAKELLLSSDMNMTQIAAALGFCDAGYFTNFFCDKAGITPSCFRKRAREPKSKR